ncbi:SusE domain-containing protein [Pseudopedobacter beijingensis]|uniref:SusE domain-containing protein n=1 Tax=Pseudopedobacter beijingensis TaxID=1207056 RepID=A0ABW4IDL2_9SPHI
MKKIINKVVILLSVIGIASCKKSDMNFKDATVTAVKSLYEPTDGKTVYLENSQNQTVYFEWEQAKSEDGAAPGYEVIFDKENGDFSQPIYRITSANNGSANYIAVSHRVLNKVAYLSGFEVGEIAKFKWAVVSSRGINEVISLQSKLLQVVRYEGFVEIPQALFLKGEGSEVGDNATQALKFTRKSDGVFEIYTRLQANKAFDFIDAKTGTYTSYYFDNEELKEGTNNSQVTEDAVYRIKLDFNKGESIVEIVDRLYLFYPLDGVYHNFTYDSKGIWTLSSKIRVKYVSWAPGGEIRYKYRMTIRKAGASTTTTESWGHKENDKQEVVTATTDRSYFDLFKNPSGADDFAYSFRYSKELMGMPAGNGVSETWWESASAMNIKLFMNTDNSANYHQEWTY